MKYFYLISFYFFKVITKVNCGKPRPNIIVIMADDSAQSVIGRYANHNSSYNNVLKDHVSTPYIDSIGADGITFTQASVENSICGPGRAAFLTGQFTHGHGVGCVSCKTGINEDSPMYPWQLTVDGYETAHIGKWHLSVWEGKNAQEVSGTPSKMMHTYTANVNDQGKFFGPRFSYSRNHEYTRAFTYEPGGGYNAFKKRYGDTVDKTSNYASDVYTDEAINFMETVRDKKKPFMLNLWFKAPHSDYEASNEDMDFFADGTTFPVPKSLFISSCIGEKMGSQSPFKGYNSGAHAMASRPPHICLNNQGAAGCERGSGQGYYGTYSGETRTPWGPVPDLSDAPAGTKPNKNICDAEVKYKAYQHYVLKMLRSMKSTDRNVGRILQYLKEKKLEDNTIVVYTSDQGYFVGEHGSAGKRTILDPTIRTPVLMKYPGVIPAGQYSDIMIQNVDVAPTFMDLAGVSFRGPIHGKSAARVARGLTDKWHTDFQLFNHYHSEPFYHGIRSKNFTYGRIWYQNKFVYDYFDNVKDPEQMTNLAYGLETEDIKNIADPDFKAKMLFAQEMLDQKIQDVGAEMKDMSGMCAGMQAFSGGCSQKDACTNPDKFPQCAKCGGKCKAAMWGLATINKLGCTANINACKRINHRWRERPQVQQKYPKNYLY